MNESMNILQELSFNGGAFSLNFLTILKVPIILALLGNIFFSAILFLRVRILADTFKTPRNKTVKQFIMLYIALVIIGTLLSLLFVILT
jgi:hypothetical protein